MIVAQMKSVNIAVHLTEPGNESPYRDRTVEENLDLFERMRNGGIWKWRKSSSCKN